VIGGRSRLHYKAAHACGICTTEVTVVSLKDVFKTRIDRAAQLLEQPSTESKTIQFGSSELSSPDKLEQLHAQFPRKIEGVTYLYRLSVDTNDTALASQVRLEYRRARAKKIFNMSRDNEEHPNSNSLYVGTSKSLYDRFRTHLGRGAGKSTWALYLSEWATQLKPTFTVEYYEFRDAFPEDVELIEGVLWDSLCPMFGKKGGK